MYIGCLAQVHEVPVLTASGSHKCITEPHCRQPVKQYERPTADNEHYPLGVFRDRGAHSRIHCLSNITGKSSVFLSCWVHVQSSKAPPRNLLIQKQHEKTQWLRCKSINLIGETAWSTQPERGERERARTSMGKGKPLS